MDPAALRNRWKSRRRTMARRPGSVNHLPGRFPGGYKLENPRKHSSLAPERLTNVASLRRVVFALAASGDARKAH